jgi:DNA-binding NarL/FixJ family response regulator
MRILIVDDERIRHETLKLRLGENEFFDAFGYYAAKEFLEKFSPFDFIHLDYDLLDRCGTGMSVVQLIIKLPEELKPRSVNCHSQNPYRRVTMAKLLINCGVTATCCAFE